MKEDKWMRIGKIYKRFASDYDDTCFCDSCALEMKNHESLGLELNNGHENGYELGKKWMDVTIEMWRYGIRNFLLFPKPELIESPSNPDGFPEWFLRKIKIIN